MGFFAKLMGRLGSKPAAPRPAGHRGVGLGLGAKPWDAKAPVQTGVSADEVEGFLKDQQPLFVYSSNLTLAQYFPDDHKLMVEFHSGHKGVYDDVTPQEALQFAQAPSKGRFLNDVIIGRENLSGNAHWTVNGGASRHRYTPLG